MRVNSLKHNQADYPEVLRHIPSPPKGLFWIGTSPNELLSYPRLAIVGSRKISGYGQTVTDRLASELARAGIVIVSGLALGVDAVAHAATLQAGGITMAVLPTALDQIYPPSHLSLAKRIVEQGGCLISEYPSGSQIHRTNFIARNRLVSGLADGLLITEAAKDSGTMHTAGFALEQGRPVMAVPGNINSPTSEGCNNLIKTGATPVTSVEDIFQALNLKTVKSPAKVFRGSPTERRLYELIGQGVADMEELAHAVNLDGPTVSSSLTMLEINGYVRAEAGSWSLR